MSEINSQNEIAISSEELIRQALSPQVIEALKREANNRNTVTFLIIQDPQQSKRDAGLEMLFGPPQPRPLGRLHVTGLSEHRITIHMETLDEPPSEIFRASMNVADRDVLIEYPGSQPHVHAKAISVLLQSPNGDRLDRSLRVKLGPSQNMPQALVPAVLGSNIG